MTVSSHQLLLQVKNALVISVFVTCTLLLTVGWKRVDPGFVRPHTYLSTEDNSSSFSTATTSRQLTVTASSAKTVVVPPTRDDSCKNPGLTVLGKPLDPCGASEAVRLAEEEDIYVSVKTTCKNNATRMLPVLLTWFQSLKPQQIHVVTDMVSENDILYQVASKIGIDIVTTDCDKVHSKIGLCCKSRNEYFRYLNTTTASGDLHRWYCHFDDDMYANIPALVPALREAMSKSKDGGVYFGRWPGEMVPGQPKGVRITKGNLKKLGFDFKEDLYARWATGAAYCISAVAMKKIKVVLSKHTFEEYCGHFGVSDDVTAAIIVGLAGYAISDNKMVKTHYDKLTKIPVTELPKLITSSHNAYIKNVVNVPDTIFSAEEDKTRFLTYHCLLYPSTSWCSKSN